MELDDLKNTWQEMGHQLKDKEILNNEIFNKMNKKKFTSRLKRILLPEIIGSIICVGAALYVVFNFNKLTTTSFQIAGIACIILLLLLTVISMTSIWQLYKVTNVDSTHAVGATGLHKTKN